MAEAGKIKHEHLWGQVMSWVLGLMFLFPWNCILTIGDYYYAVFPDYHPSRVFTLIFQPSALTTTLIFTCFEARVSTRLRVLLGYGGYIVMLLLFIIVDVATSGLGGVGLYVGVCALVGGVGISNGIAQGALQGDLSYMDPTHIQSFSAGIAMAGVGTSVLRFITKAAFGDSPSGIRKGALTFFAIAVLAEFVGFGMYAVVFPKLQVVKRYRIAAQQQGALTVKDDLAAAGMQAADHVDGEIGIAPPRLTVWQLAIRDWDYLVDQILVYTVSLSIFPGFLYEDTGNHELGSRYALVLVAVFNGGNFLGRYMPLVKPFYFEARRVLLLLCLSRVVFIPCFHFAAKYATGGWMMFLCIMLGLTNGWLSTLDGSCWLHKDTWAQNRMWSAICWCWHWASAWGFCQAGCGSLALDGNLKDTKGHSHLHFLDILRWSLFSSVRIWNHFHLLGKCPYHNVF